MRRLIPSVIVAVVAAVQHRRGNSERWCCHVIAPPDAKHWANDRLRRGRDRFEQAPVGVGELGSVDLLAQHSELVAQHDDLEVLPAA